MSYVSRFTVLAALVVTAAGHLTAQQANAPAEIRTSGSSIVTVPADLATVTIEFTGRGKTPQIAGQAAAERANAIRKALIATGIPRDSLPTGGRWGSWGNRSDMRLEFFGRDTFYTTNDVFTARIHNLDLVGRVIDTALAEGAQRISNVEFGRTNPKPFSVQALREATQMARSNAETMAEAAGGSLGRMIELTTESAAAFAPVSSFGASAMGAARAVQTTIVAPQLSATATVRGRWEFKPR